MPAVDRRRILEGAVQDLREAVRWYEEQSPGAGASFIGAIDEGIATIMEAPLRWPDFGARKRYVLRRYPYSIVYGIAGQEIVVVAIAHHSREPGFWNKRR